MNRLQANRMSGKEVYVKDHNELVKKLNSMDSKKEWIHYNNKPTFEEVKKDLADGYERITYQEGDNTIIITGLYTYRIGYTQYRSKYHVGVALGLK